MKLTALHDRLPGNRTGTSAQRIAMYNMIPDGTEYPAVRADFERTR